VNFNAITHVSHEATILLRNLPIFSWISMHQFQFLLEIIFFKLTSQGALRAVRPKATHVRDPKWSSFHFFTTSNPLSPPRHGYKSGFHSLCTVTIGEPLRTGKEALVAYFFRSSRKEGEISEQSLFRPPDCSNLAHPQQKPDSYRFSQLAQ